MVTGLGLELNLRDVLYSVLTRLRRRSLYGCSMCVFATVDGLRMVDHQVEAHHVSRGYARKMLEDMV